MLVRENTFQRIVTSLVNLAWISSLTERVSINELDYTRVGQTHWAGSLIGDCRDDNTSVHNPFVQNTMRIYHESQRTRDASTLFNFYHYTPCVPPSLAHRKIPLTISQHTNYINKNLIHSIHDGILNNRILPLPSYHVLLIIYIIIWLNFVIQGESESRGGINYLHNVTSEFWLKCIIDDLWW